MIRGGDSSGPRSHDRNFLRRRWRIWQRVAPAIPYGLVAQEALDTVDGDWFVELAAVARRFARMVAYAASDGGQRVGADQRFPRRLQISFGDVRDVSLSVFASGTGGMARRGTMRMDRFLEAPVTGLEVQRSARA